MTLKTSYDFKKYPYLNIGGGNFEHRDDGWLNLDFPFDAMARKRDFSNIDIAHNLMTGDPLPVPDESFEAIYTEHAMEHLPRERVMGVFKEVLRILRPRGFFRVVVPDAEKCWRVLVDTSLSVEEYPSAWRPKSQPNSKEMSFLDAVCTPLRRTIESAEFAKHFNPDSLDNTMDSLLQKFDVPDILAQSQRPGDHLSWWTNESLVAALGVCGFKDIAGPMGCRESRHAAFRSDYIDCTQHKWSLRVEGIKHD